MKKEKQIINTDIALITIGILLLIVIHFLRDDGSFISNSLSNYAATEYSNIANLAFYIFSLANILIGILFIKFNNIKIRISSFLFFLAGFFIIMLTIFHSDGNGIIESFVEYIHVISASLLFLTYPIIIILNGLQFKSKRLRYYSIFTFFTTIFLTIFGIFFTLRNLKTGLLETTWFGLFEKFGVFIIILWVIVLLLSSHNLKQDD